MYWWKEAGVNRREAKNKTKEDIHGCGERGYADGRDVATSFTPRKSKIKQKEEWAKYSNTI